MKTLKTCNKDSRLVSGKDERPLFTVFSLTGLCSLGGGSPAACADWEQWRSGDRRSAGGEARWQVASRV